MWNFSGQPTGTLPTLTVGHQAPITCQVKGTIRSPLPAYLPSSCASALRLLSFLAWTGLCPLSYAPASRHSCDDTTLMDGCALAAVQAWQPDGEGWLATAGKDGRLMVYDVDASLPMREGMPHVSQPGAIALTGGE